MKNGFIALGFFLSACGLVEDGPGNDVGQNDQNLVCSGNLIGGTYKVSFNEKSGDCGPIPSQMFSTDTADDLLSGCKVLRSKFDEDT